MPFVIAKQLPSTAFACTCYIFATHLTHFHEYRQNRQKLILVIHHKATKLISMIKQKCYDVPTLQETVIQRQLVVTNKEHGFYYYVS
jgi:hypothetical protein